MDSPNLPYRPELKELARHLRTHSTLAEVLLWTRLNRRQRQGIDFHRQRPIGEYIVDFFAPELMLAIEIDGQSHAFKAEADKLRQQTLESMGIRVLRFGDAEVKRNCIGVVGAIDAWIGAEKARIAGASTRPG